MTEHKTAKRRKRARLDEPRFVPLLLWSDLPDDLIGRLCVLAPPSDFVEVDLPVFVRKIAGSLSLDACVKWRAFSQLPSFSQFQVDALIKVLDLEVATFTEQAYEHWSDVTQLCARSWLHLCLVADHMGAGYDDPDAERQALRDMLQRKYDASAHRGWVQRALSADADALTTHVFSAFDSLGEAPPSRRPSALDVAALTPSTQAKTKPTRKRKGGGTPLVF